MSARGVKKFRKEVRRMRNQIFNESVRQSINALYTMGFLRRLGFALRLIRGVPKKANTVR